MTRKNYFLPFIFCSLFLYATGCSANEEQKSLPTSTMLNITTTTEVQNTSTTLNKDSEEVLEENKEIRNH